MREGSFSLAMLGAAGRMLPAQSEADSNMQWIQSAMSTTRAFAMRGEARTIADGPEVAVVADSVVGDRRRLTLRFTAPSSTLARRVNGAAYVRAVAIDGIPLDNARYRRVPDALSIPFTAPPDSGFTAVIEAPADSAVVLRLAAVTAGLPVMRELRVTARPAAIVAVQGGDITVRFRRVELARAARKREK